MEDKKKILIVEDDEDIQEIYKEMIDGNYDISLEQCFNGKEAVEAIKKQTFDLIILDLLMPVMNGEEFLKELRYTYNMKDVPVVICSVNQALAHRLLGENEANAVLPKLFRKEDLDNIFDQFLNIQSSN